MASVPLWFSRRVYLSIAGVDRTDPDQTARVKAGSIRFQSSLNNQQTLSFTIEDPDGSYHPQVNDVVVLGDRVTTALSTSYFAGTIDRIEEFGIGLGLDPTSPAREFTCSCLDFNLLLDRFYVGEVYEDMSAGDIVRDLILSPKIFSNAGPGILGSLGDQGVTIADVQSGAHIARLVLDVVKFSAALQELDQASGYTHWIDSEIDGGGSPRKGLHFVKPLASSIISGEAPYKSDPDFPFPTITIGESFSIDDVATTLRSIMISRSLEQYANEIFIRFKREAGVDQADTFTGDGASQTFTLSLRPAIEPKILLNGVEQTIALSPETTNPGSQWYWQIGSLLLVQAAADPPLAGTDVLEVTYFPLFANIFGASDEGEIASRGRYQFLEDRTDLADFDSIDARAQAVLRRSARGLDPMIQVETDEPGIQLRPGNVINVQASKYGLTGAFLITELSGRDEPIDTGATHLTGAMRWTFSAVSGERQGGFQEYFRALFGPALEGGGAAVATAGVGGYQIELTILGNLSVGADVSPHYPIRKAGTLREWAAIVKGAAAGTSIVVTFRRNGNEIFTAAGDRVTIPAGITTTAIGTVFDPVEKKLEVGDVLTADVVQVGSTANGSDLTVVLTVK